MQEANIEGPLRLQHDMRYLRGVPLEQDGNLVQVLRPRGDTPYSTTSGSGWRRKSTAPQDVGTYASPIRKVDPPYLLSIIPILRISPFDNALPS